MDKRRILVADDEPGIRAVVARMLDQDYVVLEATNGQEAVDIAGRERPDAILMDLMMPEVDGYTACSRIKADQATKAIPVIILTAVGHDFNRKYATEMGADGYITKPFTRQVLVDAIVPLLTGIPHDNDPAT
jgi:diguanylate cyclase